MKMVTIQVSVAVADEARPDKWIAEGIQACLEEGEFIHDCHIVSEFSLDEQEL